jgi:1-acyl-sn-glycerol-3-phosphate acyltransferase
VLTIKTILIFLLVGLYVLLFFPLGMIAIVLSFAGLKKSMSVLTYKLAQGWALATVMLSGCTLTVEGKENIPKEGGVCFVSNHGSIFDIVILLANIGRPFGFISKKELIFIPLLNVWIAILGGLFINRSNPRKALITINTGIHRLQAGSAILIFPEGHRSKGQGLLPFKPGSFKLATQSGVPIVPMAISGSYEVFEKNYCLNPGPVRLVFSTPLIMDDISAENRKQFLAQEVQKIIQTALNDS